MAKEGIGSKVSALIIKQLEKRQEVVGKEGDLARKSYILSTNTPWIKLRSSVNQINEEVNLDNLVLSIERGEGIESNGKAAENFQLAGGTLEANQKNARAGVNRRPNEINTEYAYSNFNSDYGLGFRPMPGITDATIKSKGTFGTLSEANISFKVFSVEDLEICELLYFRPGYTALLEWGNSVFITSDGNILKTGTETVTIPNEFFFERQNVEKITEQINKAKDAHEGNYDALFGFITNFSFEIQKDGSYDCSVKIVSSGAILEGLKPPLTSDKTDEEEDGTETENRKQKSVYHYLFHYLRKEGPKGQFSGREKLVKHKQLKLAQYLTDFQVFSYISDMTGHFLGDQHDDNIPIQYVRLGDFLMFVNKLNSWRVPGTDPKTVDADFILFDLGCTNDAGDYIGNKFVTFPDHISCDPVVAMPPKLPTGETADQNGTSASTNIFQWVGLQGLRDAGEVYKKCILYDLSPKMEEHARNSDGGLDDILNIYVSTYAIEKSITDILTGPQDDTVGMYNVIKDVLSNIQAAFGEVNNFDLFYNYRSCRYQVVDRQRSPNLEDLPEINMSGKNSIVSNINISSTISSAIASQVAIAAQGGSGNTKENLSTLMEWNRGAIDRHIVRKGTDDKDDAEQRAKAQAKYLKKLYNFFYKWNDGAGAFTDQDYIAEDIESLRSEINADMQSLRNFDTIKNKKSVQGVVPVELSFDLDGIQGFLIGTTFKINKGLLPKKYDNWAYIITGLEHKVSKSRWITSIKTQFYPNRYASSAASDKLKAASGSSNSSSPTFVDNVPDVGKNVVDTPNANDLRATLETLGYTEKGTELTSGNADITKNGLMIGRSVARMIKKKHPGIKVRFTGGNDSYHMGFSNLSRHKQGNGLDFTIDPHGPKDVKKIVRILDGFAAGSYPNFAYLNEYKNPSKNASGAHFHISWHDSGGSEGQANRTNAKKLADLGRIPKHTIT